jgi:hypothetical protein
VDFWELRRLAASFLEEMGEWRSRELGREDLRARAGRFGFLIRDLDLRGADVDWSIKAMLMKVSPRLRPLFLVPSACTLGAGECSQESLNYFRV